MDKLENATHEAECRRATYRARDFAVGGLFFACLAAGAALADASVVFTGGRVSSRVSVAAIAFLSGVCSFGCLRNLNKSINGAHFCPPF
jgi:hypothetical protein